MVVESIMVGKQSDWDETITYSDFVLNEEIRLLDSHIVGFMVNQRFAKRYFKFFENRKIGFNAEYWPNGIDRSNEESSGAYLIEFNAKHLGMDINVENLHTKETLLYASIGGFTSRLNNGCNIYCDGRPKLYSCEKLHFIDKSAKRMFDAVLKQIA